MKKTKAFTILELMVVCAIIGILAAIVFVSLDRGKTRARDAQRKSDITRIAGAMESYRVDKKSYISSGALEADLFAPLMIIPASLATEGYIDSVPADPLVTPALQSAYKFISDGSQYKILASSETISADDVTNNKAKEKAGDFYNPTLDSNVEQRCFQISSGIAYLDASKSTIANYCNR